MYLGRGDHTSLLAFEALFLAAVEEERHMSVFLRFGAVELFRRLLRQPLRQHVGRHHRWIKHLEFELLLVLRHRKQFDVLNETFPQKGIQVNVFVYLLLPLHSSQPLVIQARII